MKARFILFVLFPFVLLFPQCKKENACDCFKGTGDIVTEERQLQPYHNVYVEDNVNLIFVEDTMNIVRVEAGKHLIKLVKTESDGEWLRIRNDNKCNFMRRYGIPINVYIHYVRNSIYHIKTKGTGEITNANPCTSDSIDLDVESSGDITFEMNSPAVYTHQHGAGDITLTGHSDNVIIYSRGTGFTITDGITSGYTWVSTNTTGKITVAPSNLLIVEILGPGNVYYKGTPASIVSSELNTGKLLPL
ncbi:MAG TPA: DUF2807 domain-containing protein [Bacteroidia bacterium]|nr:DUF2807 domain-containing protein [Bacteroidia bacterium]